MQRNGKNSTGDKNEKDIIKEEEERRKQRKENK